MQNLHLMIQLTEDTQKIRIDITTQGNEVARVEFKRIAVLMAPVEYMKLMGKLSMIATSPSMSFTAIKQTVDYHVANFQEALDAATRTRLERIS